MLTKPEREWLDEQRGILMHAASEVDVYNRELIATQAWTGGTRVERMKRRIELDRLEKLRMHWDSEIFRRHLLITAWLQAYQATHGESRGPISLTDALAQPA